MSIRVHFKGAVALHTERINGSTVSKHLHMVMDVVAFDAVLTTIRIPAPVKQSLYRMTIR